MTDEDLHERINRLVKEEHVLHEAHTDRGLTDEERARLRAVEVDLQRLLGPPAPASSTPRRRP